MIVSGYTLHLYCDHPAHKGFISHQGGYFVLYEDRHFELRHEFAGSTESICRKQARAKGWKFLRERRVICPFCAKLEKTP